MKRLEQIQQGKIMSSYGGVGSIIETNTNGSLQILPYNKWKCFGKDQIELENLREITDPRLLALLKRLDTRYANIQKLVRIPEANPNVSKYSADSAGIIDTVTAEYFPSWFYCPKCRRLKVFDEWKEMWNDTFSNDNKFEKNEPACYNCSKPQNDENFKNKKKQKPKKTTRIHREKLQQVRFVMASLFPAELQDIPFNKLPFGKTEGLVWLISSDSVPRDLYYKNIQDRDGLDSIYIEDKKTSECILLSQIERCYLINDSKAFKMLLRGSQSLYFPNIIRSIYISTPSENAPSSIEEMDSQEFEFLTDRNIYKNNIYLAKSGDLFVRLKPDLDNRVSFVKSIRAIERLKETSVLTYYTRVGRADETRRWYSYKEKKEVDNISPGKEIPFSTQERDAISYMPATESFGEGILFEIDTKNVPENDRELFVHTMCHIVMKEMEFECGYPLTSLKEKIYFSKNGDAGFLIYTVAGSEGSFGGLVSLTDSDKILRLIENGALRAQYCPNDPICLNSEKRHCYACLDIPEISCCKFNDKLDRKIFIGLWPYDSTTCSFTKDNIIS